MSFSVGNTVYYKSSAVWKSGVIEKIRLSKTRELLLKPIPYSKPKVSVQIKNAHREPTGKTGSLITKPNNQQLNLFE